MLNLFLLIAIPGFLVSQVNNSLSFDGVVTVPANVLIDPENDAPVLTDIGNQETSEDTPLVLTLEASDVDEDDLTFSATSEYPENVAADVTGNQLTLTPTEDWNGSMNISVSVSDGFLTDSETFELTVTPMNDVPVAQNINISTTEDTPVEVPVSGSEIEGDTLTFELVDSPQYGGLGPSFVISIDAVGGGQTHFLNLGFLPFATDVYDVGIDIYAPPPPPPPGFAAALGWEGDRYFTQIVEGSADDLVEHICISQ